MANVKSISFGPGQQNADLQAQQMQLQRQQKLAEMLRQQSLQQPDTQVVSGVAVKNSPWIGATKLAQAFLANRMDADSDDKQATIGNEVAKRSADALRSLAPAGVFDDAPAANMPPDTAQGFTPPTDRPQIDPELRSRWVRALATYQQNPELGGKLIQDLSKEAEYSTTPQYDQQGRAFVLNNRGQRKDLEGVKARDKWDVVNGRFVNGYTQEVGGAAPQDVNVPFMVGDNGQPIANQAYQNYSLTRAKAGAPNITTKTEVKAAEGIAAQIGPMLKESAMQADGAVSQIDAADRVIKAVDTNKIYAGPLASKRLSLAQFGQVLGVGGKDEAEVIANTRNAVRGLAEMTLQGRKQMSGQGAITESESKLAEKAISGDIDSMTPAELKIIANASRRAAQHTLKSHQRKVDKARNNPATAGIADYFDTTPYESAPGVDDLLKKYGGK